MIFRQIIDPGDDLCHISVVAGKVESEVGLVSLHVDSEGFVHLFGVRVSHRELLLRNPTSEGLQLTGYQIER